MKAEDSPEEKRLKGSNTSRAAGIRKLKQLVDKADADINAQKPKIPKVLEKRYPEELTRCISQKIEVNAAIVREAQSLHASEVVVAPERNLEAAHRVEEFHAEPGEHNAKGGSGLRNIQEIRGC